MASARPALYRREVRSHISSGSSFERDYGYSRAVLDGERIYLSGTTGFDYATMTIDDDVEAQTRRAFGNLEAALLSAGATLADLVRVRYYVAERDDWPVIGRVAGELLAEARPAATAIICQLIDPRIRIEIEADARRRPAGHGWV
jgi:enamine deaminase RidA (YjgF/YER057c/UK114 family)